MEKRFRSKIIIIIIITLGPSVVLHSRDMSSPLCMYA